MTRQGALTGSGRARSRTRSDLQEQPPDWPWETREIIKVEVLKRPWPATFLGRKTQEPFVKEREE